MSKASYFVTEDGHIGLIPGSISGSGSSGSDSSGVSSLEFPASFATSGSTLQFCQSIDETASATVGKTYLGGVTLTDMPPGIGNSEVIVRIMTDSKVIVLEMFSTNVSPNHWYAMYDGDMTTGTSANPWQGIPSVKIDSSNGYTPTENYSAATKKYVDDAVAAVSGGTSSSTAVEYAATMPTAAAANLNKVYQFTGTTTSTYTKGHFYVCTLSDSTYSWTDITPLTETVLDSVIINGTEPEIVNKKQSFTVRACQAFPSAVRGQTSNDHYTITTLDFCRDIVDPTKGNCRIGMMYTGTTFLKDTPLDGDHRSEILVKVIGGSESSGEYVLELELTSTSYHERSWIAMFYGNSTTGAMQFGSPDCPWFARLMTPLSGYSASNKNNDAYLDKEYTAASQKYVDDAVAAVSGGTSYTAGIGIEINSGAIEVQHALELDPGTTTVVTVPLTHRTDNDKFGLTFNAANFNTGGTTVELLVDEQGGITTGSNGLAVDYTFVQGKLVAASGVTITGGTSIEAPKYGSTDTTSIPSGTVAVAGWTKYTGTCDALTIASIANSDMESMLLVTFAGTASAPDIGFPVGTHYPAEMTFPTYEAGKTYLISVQNNWVIVSEQATVEAE